ncbi:MAG: dual OB domain-containing protein [Vulcanimicrobiaceae bacterium]
MNAGQVCVASIDLHTKKIARPLQWNHSNWPETLVEEGLTPGRIVRQRIRKEQNPQGLPHETEDVQLTDDFQILGKCLGEPELFAVLLPIVDASVAAIFGEALVGSKFVPEHSRVRSLGRVRADTRSVTVYLDRDRPRIDFRDGQTNYDVPVTDLRVRRAFDAGAIELVERAIRTAAGCGSAMIIGLGLARPWAGSSNDFSPKRCYLQANGLIFPFEAGLARRLA